MIKNFNQFNEGLIKSCSIEQLQRILLKKFPELKLNINNFNMQIGISGINSTLDKYIPTINNLGYFINNIFGEGGKSLKDVNVRDIDLNKIQPKSIYIVPKYDKEADFIPDFVYHVTYKKHIDKIMKIGLVSNTKNKYNIHPERIYVSFSIGVLVDMSYYLQDPIFLGIDMRNIKDKYKLYTDSKCQPGAFYLIGNIPPENIKVIDKNNLHDHT